MTSVSGGLWNDDDERRPRYYQPAWQSKIQNAIGQLARVVREETGTQLRSITVDPELYKQIRDDMMRERPGAIVVDICVAYDFGSVMILEGKK